MDIDPEKPVQPAMQERCAVRLANDARALEARSCGRMRIAVKRFGPRPVAIGLRFPAVRTSILDRATGEVAVRPAEVTADIVPNSGSQAPYPFGPPMVRVGFPGLAPGRQPWLPGLLWMDDAVMAAADPVTAGLGMVHGISPGRPAGIPCLWRQGGWSPDCDLLFVARQVHRMLADPGDYSPTDAMNAEAALYWAAHKGRLPFEPPISELLGEARLGVETPRPASRLTLEPLE